MKAGAEFCRVLKHDVFGRIELTERDGALVVRRVACGSGVMGSRWLATRFAQREQRLLRRLSEVDRLPRALGAGEQRDFYRSYIEARPLYEVGSLGAAYWRELRALVEAVHRAGVAHNDLAKEANILVTPDGRPGLVDLQIGWALGRAPWWPARQWFALLCREDVRHILKMKALHDPELVTPSERRLIEQKSWPVRLWSATLMRPYQRLIARLGWDPSHGPRSQ